MPSRVEGSIALAVAGAIDLVPRAGRRTVQAVGRRMLHHIRYYTPEDTGKLKDGWYLTRPARQTEGGWSISVETEVDYAPHVEWDTQAHLIEPKDPNGVLSWIGGDGERKFAKWVRHPGTSGQHMVARGVARTRQEVEDLGEKELRRWAKESGF